jgi:hypothetical protein
MYFVRFVVVKLSILYDNFFIHKKRMLYIHKKLSVNTSCKRFHLNLTYDN